MCIRHDLPAEIKRNQKSDDRSLAKNADKIHRALSLQRHARRTMQAASVLLNKYGAKLGFWSNKRIEPE